MDSDSEESFEYSDAELEGGEDENKRKPSSPSVRLVLQAKKNFQILGMKELMLRQQELISETCELLSLGEDKVTILLIYYNWNSEKLLDEYMTNPKKTLEQAGATFDLTYKPKKKLKGKFWCPVLFGEFDFEETLALGCVSKQHPNPEEHRFSREAWREYLRSRANEGSESIRSSCQREKCNCMVPPSVWEDVLLNFKCEESDYEHAYRRYQTYMLNSFVDLKKNIKWCPTPGCGVAVEVPPRDVVDVVFCSNCSNHFCFRCNKPDHSPVICQLLVIWEEKCQNESETANWILAHTKSCPKCNVRIEKNKGCNHMKCQKCQFDFCWVCMGSWTEHGNNTGGYYNCNRYVEGTTYNSANAKEQAKVELEKYLHYYKRFVGHDQSLSFAKSQLEEARKRMEEMQQHHGAGWVEVQYLGQAVQQLVENRRMLKFSYALAYYLPDSPGKRILEDNQSLLESYTERLSELTEVDIDKLDKGKVNNQAIVTRKFLAKVKEAVQREELNEAALVQYRQIPKNKRRSKKG